MVTPVRVDYSGILRGAYYVRHKITGECRIVELGARYNQVEWVLIGAVPTEVYDAKDTDTV